MGFYFSLDGLLVEPDLSRQFCPDHKAAMLMFLDRVYGIENQNFLLHLIQVGFLPDLQAAVSLDEVSYWRLCQRTTVTLTSVPPACLHRASNTLTKCFLSVPCRLTWVPLTWL